MTSLSQGMASMNISRPTTPRGQGTRAYNAQPKRQTGPKNRGKGSHGKKLHFGYQEQQPGGRRKRRKSRRSRKRRKSRRKSRKRRRRTKKRRRRRR